MAFTPYFGAAAGGSLALNRYLAIDVGVARLWYDVPKDTDTIDQAPVDTAAPFRLAFSNAWFIAAGYNFAGK